MKPSRNVQINLAIPEQYRNLLRRMAAERMMSDPSQVVTGSSIATELLLAALKDIEKFNDEKGGKNND
jgi:hypothetical protein